MANQPKSLLSSFTFTPDVDELVATDAQGKIEVRVTDNAGNTRYTATITNVVSLSGPPPAPVDLPRQGSTNIFSGQVPAGLVPNTPPPPNNPNKKVTVQSFQGTVPGDADEHAVRVWSGGSASGSMLAGAAIQCHFCGTDQPVPVALQLCLDSPVTPGTWAGCAQLNQPTLLLHAEDPGHLCCWFSQPFDAYEAGPTLWQLQKQDPHTWELLLRRGHSDLVTYRYKTARAQDCSFPIALNLVGEGSGDCQNWPRTVTIEPAP